MPNDATTTEATNDRSGAPANNGAGAPERRCLVRGESGPVDNLIRFVVSPDGAVIADLTEKLPGRGMWVTADTECLETAITKKMFNRAAGQAVTVAPTLIADTAALLTARVQNHLGLAKRSSNLMTGADAVRDAAGKGKFSYVLVARDASAAGLADMAGRRDTPTLRLPMDGAALGAALGRENAIYIGLLPGKQADALFRDIKRLNGIVNKDLYE